MQDGGVLPRLISPSYDIKKRSNYISEYIPLLDITKFKHYISDPTGKYMIWIPSEDSSAGPSVRKIYKMGYDFKLVEAPELEPEMPNMLNIDIEEYNEYIKSHLMDYINISEKITIPYYYFLLQKTTNILEQSYLLAPDNKYINKILRIDQNDNFVTISSSFNCINLFIFINKYSKLLEIIQTVPAIDKTYKEYVIDELKKIFTITDEDITTKFSLNNYYDMLFYAEIQKKDFNTNTKNVMNNVNFETYSNSGDNLMEISNIKYENVSYEEGQKKTSMYKSPNDLNAVKRVLTIERNIETDISKLKLGEKKILEEGDYFEILANDILDLKELFEQLGKRERDQYLFNNTYKNDYGQHVLYKGNTVLKPEVLDRLKNIMGVKFLMAYFYFRLQKKEINGILPINLKQQLYGLKVESINDIKKRRIDAYLLKHGVSSLNDKLYLTKILRGDMETLRFKVLDPQLQIQISTEDWIKELSTGLEEVNVNGKLEKYRTFSMNKIKKSKYFNLLENELFQKLPPIYEYTMTIYNGINYPNCVENSLMQFCKLLIWNPQSSNYEIKQSIKDKMSIDQTSQEFSEFLTDLFVKKNGENEQTNDNNYKWTNLILPLGSIFKGDNRGQKFTNVIKKINQVTGVEERTNESDVGVELKSDFRNVVKIFSRIFNINGTNITEFIRELKLVNDNIDDIIFTIFSIYPNINIETQLNLSVQSDIDTINNILNLGTILKAEDNMIRLTGDILIKYKNGINVTVQLGHGHAKLLTITDIKEKFESPFFNDSFKIYPALIHYLRTEGNLDEIKSIIKSKKSINVSYNIQEVKEIYRGRLYIHTRQINPISVFFTNKNIISNFFGSENIVKNDGTEIIPSAEINEIKEIIDIFFNTNTQKMIGNKSILEEIMLIINKLCYSYKVNLASYLIKITSILSTLKLIVSKVIVGQGLQYKDEIKPIKNIFTGLSYDLFARYYIPIINPGYSLRDNSIISNIELPDEIYDIALNVITNLINNVEIVGNADNYLLHNLYGLVYGLYITMKNISVDGFEPLISTDKYEREIRKLIMFIKSLKLFMKKNESMIKFPFSYKKGSQKMYGDDTIHDIILPLIDSKIEGKMEEYIIRSDEIIKENNRRMIEYKKMVAEKKKNVKNGASSSSAEEQDKKPVELPWPDITVFIPTIEEIRRINPAFIYPTLDKILTLTKIAENSIINPKVQGGGSYYSKYIKYKIKYIKLLRERGYKLEN